VSPPPRVSGISMVRNAIKYRHPVAESLRSLAPLVDQVVVAVGKGDEGTLKFPEPLYRVLYGFPDVEAHVQGNLVVPGAGGV
jgi:hypothetical protein